jgi:outer membrane protein
MQTKIIGATLCFWVLWFLPLHASGQNADSTWTLEKCIEYALQKNIQVQKAYLTNDINKVNADQSKYNRLPSVSASISHNFLMSKLENDYGKYGSYMGSNNSSYSVSSSVTLFNGFKIKNNIRQSKLTYEAGKYDAETTKETISLSVLNAYLEVLYAEEQVKNSQKQVESIEQQVKLAEERFALGAISKSDYLQVKSELASEKQTVASSESTLAIDRVTLMQLLEIPLNDSFAIYHPSFDSTINEGRVPQTDSIYTYSLTIKPQVKSAQLNKESAEISVDIARAGYMPSLSLTAEVSSGFTNLYDGDPYGFQVKNKLTPLVGFTLTIPIFQNNSVRAKVDVAKINIKTAELTETSTKNDLRKSIEQASVDVVSAQKEFEANTEAYNSALESFQVAQEKYNQGLINFVNFLIQKTNLITAENDLLQSKYKLIFNYKTLDFYSGNALTL